MTWPGFEPRPLDPESSALTITPSCLPHRGKITWFCLVIMRTDVDVNCHTIKEKQERLFSATFPKTVNMTNKQSPEEISALDSSKHGDSPNSLGKPDSIIEGISLMTKQLASSITTLNYSMDHCQWRRLGKLRHGERDRQGANQDSGSTKDQNLSGSSNANNVNDQLTNSPWVLQRGKLNSCRNCE